MEKFINKVIQGDCLEILRQLPDKSIDLVITDPPYGIKAARSKRGGKQHGKALAKSVDYGQKDWDDSIPSKQIFDEIFRVSKNQIIFGGNYFVEHLKNSPCWIVWDKNTGNNGYADCELVYTSFKTAVRKFKWTWKGFIQEDMKNKEKRVHPTQKPLPLMKWIIEKYSKPEDIILDPFAGSCTTAVAAQELGRKYICIEKEGDYVKICDARLLDVKEPVI